MWIEWRAVAPRLNGTKNVFRRGGYEPGCTPPRFAQFSRTTMKINLAYGDGHLPVEFPDDRTTIISPTHRPGLPDERAAVTAALEQPVGCAPEGMLTERSVVRASSS